MLPPSSSNRPPISESQESCKADTQALIKIALDLVSRERASAYVGQMERLLNRQWQSGL
jgi:hypothetical protein